MNSVARFAAVGAMVLACASGARAEVVIETATVGNPGNAGENSGESESGGYGPDRICGAVDYVYNIGTFELTAGQYTEFLNAVADDDTYGLYNTGMWTDERGCKIERTDSSPNYSYSVGAEWAERPVNYVSWGDVARFANWLHNGQPTGAQDENSTEDGSYYLNGVTSNEDLMDVTREGGATWVIPSEDEWYKAAYHKNNGVTANYWDYPTSSNSVPGYVNDSGNLSGTGTAFTEGGTDPGNYATYDGDGGTDGIGSPYYRTEVGEWENSDSPYGAFDQGANVWEWNEAVLYGSSRGLRGGSFYSDGATLPAAFRNYGSPSYEGYDVGFRVATFVDCNGNGIPDECDLDCGANIGMTGGSCNVVYPSCGQSSDNNDDGIPDECGACCGSFGEVGCLQLVQNLCLDSDGVYLGDGTVCHGTACPIPTLSEWGVGVMALLVLTAGMVVLARRRAVSAI